MRPWTALCCESTQVGRLSERNGCCSTFNTVYCCLSTGGLICPLQHKNFQKFCHSKMTKSNSLILNHKHILFISRNHQIYTAYVKDIAISATAERRTKCTLNCCSVYSNTQITHVQINACSFLLDDKKKKAVYIWSHHPYSSLSQLLKYPFYGRQVFVLGQNSLQTTQLLPLAAKLPLCIVNTGLVQRDAASEQTFSWGGGAHR